MAGIIYRDGDVLRKTEPRPLIDDLDALPWPDCEGFNYFEAVKRISENGEISAALTTSRSCPFHCTVCSHSGGAKYRQRTLDSIFAELDYLVDRYHLKKLVLSDELFAVDEARVHEFCRRIAPLHLTWWVFLRLGKRIQIELLQEMLRVLEITKKAGIKARGNFIFGDTMEILETAEYTMNWVENHADLIEGPAFSPIRLYPVKCCQPPRTL